MDGWSVLIQVSIAALGALLFLKFVADELETTLNDLREEQKRTPQRSERVPQGDDVAIEAEKAA